MIRQTLSSLAFLSIACAALLQVGCQDKKETNPLGESTGSPRRVIVATLVSHPALDQIIASMKTQMAELGDVEGRDIEYVLKNANGDQQVVASIAEEIATQEAAAVVSITTPMSQAVAKSVRVPLVFSAVTDPVGAGIISGLETPRETVTGVSDAWPYEEQLKLLREIAPGAKKLAVLFNASDAASQFGMKKIREHAPRLGFELVEGSVSSSSEVGIVAESLMDRVDAVYLSSDATVISGFSAASKACFRAKKPLMVGDSGTVEKGALAAVSVGYAGVGRETARLLHRVLKGERNIPVVVAGGDEVFLNSKAAELSGITFSEALLRKAKKVFKEIP